MTDSSFGVRLLLRSSNAYESWTHLVRAAISGWWLGVLRGESLDPLATFPYDTLGSDASDEFKHSGLHWWERRSLDEYFGECRTLLLAGAGGGRELLALRRHGFDVDGFDFAAQLVAASNELLAQEGFVGSIAVAPHGTCPALTKTYDGAMLGRCSYMLIRGRSQRVMFLKTLRSRLRDGAPLYLSFHDRTEPSRRFGITFRLANLLRWLLRRPDRIERGDHLDPESGFFHHHFTQHEIASELREAGFELLRYSTTLHPHAVGRAMPTTVHRDPSPHDDGVNESVAVAANC